MQSEAKKVGIRIKSCCRIMGTDMSEPLCYFTEAVESSNSDENAKKLTQEIRRLYEDNLNDDQFEIYTEGELYTGDGRLEIRYREPNELTGMGNSVTSISYKEADPSIITVARGGDVYSALVLEKGVRHTCVYNTDAMPLLVYTTAKRINNSLTSDGGTLDLVYTVALDSNEAQYTHVNVTVTCREEDEKCRS